jgi:hypothetical protein
LLNALVPSFRTTSNPLFLRHLETLSQALNLELLTRGTLVDILHVVGGGLKVRSGIVALGDEDVVLGAVLERLVQRDRGSL